MSDTITLTEAMEDYLEAIYHLRDEQGETRVKDIAERMGVTMPSASSAINALSDLGLINHEKYGAVTLTPQGRDMAEYVARRHQALICFLRDILQLDEDIADAEACRLEHAVSPETLRRLLAMIDFVLRCPRGGEQWLEHLAGKWDHATCNHNCRECIASIEVPERNPFAPVEPGGNELTLRDLEPGEKGRVLKLTGHSRIRRRIMDMGLIPGSEVEVERLAPLGDPIEVKVRDYHLSLRKGEAAQIAVERI
ncbi:MAG: DtxR family transcriptional regulator [Armatimonadetes bacterium]|nr:DtxR family transcriptional regulator [Armatimonadota bacterium]